MSFFVAVFLVCLALVAGKEEGVVFPSDEEVLLCKTKDGHDGVCKEIEKCPSALKTISNETPTICHFLRTQPIVCCVEEVAISVSLTKNEDNSSPDVTSEEEQTKAPTSVDEFVDNCGIRPTYTRSTSGSGTYFIRRKRDFHKVVVGGKESIPYSWPWMVVIARVSTIGTSRFLCGGSLLNARYVLSAAHCFDENLPASRYQVFVGLHVKTEGTIFNVTKLTVHEKYEPRRGYNDIAILKLAKDVELSNEVGAVCLPESSSGTHTGKTATITGWGDTSFGGNSSNVLREVIIPIVSNKACNGSYFRPGATRFNQGILKSQLCAGLSEGGKDACQGDSGGPLMLETGINRWSIVGIVSYGIGCADPGFPGVYTRVQRYLSWIKKKSGITPPEKSSGPFGDIKVNRPQLTYI